MLFAQSLNVYVHTKGKSEYFTRAARGFIEHRASLGCGGGPTVLFDEPDKSLSIENQMMFWGYSLPRIGQERQVIVATHSPLVLLSKRAWHFIDVEDGYAAQSRHLVKWMAEHGEPDRANMIVIFQKRADEAEARKKAEEPAKPAKKVAKKKAAKKKGK